MYRRVSPLTKALPRAKTIRWGKRRQTTQDHPGPPRTLAQSSPHGCPLPTGTPAHDLGCASIQHPAPNPPEPPYAKTLHLTPWPASVRSPAGCAAPRSTPPCTPLGVRCKHHAASPTCMLQDDWLMIGMPHPPPLLLLCYCQFCLSVHASQGRVGEWAGRSGRRRM